MNLGQPDRTDHDNETGVLSMIYKVEGGALMKVEMKYEVTGVKQVMDMAEFDLL